LISRNINNFIISSGGGGLHLFNIVNISAFLKKKKIFELLVHKYYYCVYLWTVVSVR